MSLGIYPEFEQELTGTAFDATGEALAFNFEALDNIALVANLTPFTAFADSRTIPDDFEGDPDDLPEIMGEWSEWFDPSQGQAAMQTLADHIRTNPYDARQLQEPDGVVDELLAMARVLRVAAEHGVRFRLQMS